MHAFRYPTVLHVLLIASCAKTAQLASPPAAQFASPIHIDLGANEPWQDGDVQWSRDTLGTHKRITAANKRLFGTRRPHVYSTAIADVRELALPLQNGAYTVVLHFAELDESVTAAGQRVFTVDVEGQSLGNIDLWDQAGGVRVPLVKSVPVVVQDGALSLAFTWQGQRGSLLNAMQVWPAAAVTKEAAPAAITPLESFDNVPDQEGLQKLIAWDGTNNRSTVSLAAPAPHTGSVVRWDYTIDTSIGYGDRTAITMDKFKAEPIDVSQASVNAFRFWWQPDGSGRHFSVQLRGKGVWWNYDLRMNDATARWVTIPFDVFGRGNMAFSSRPGPVVGNITGIGFFIQYIPGSELGSGSVYLDNLQFVKTQTPNTLSAALPTYSPAFHASPQASVLDDFESYESDAQLRANFGNIVHGHMCTLSLDAKTLGAGKHALRLDYGFGKREYSGLVMMPHVDWSQHNAFRFWVKPDNSNNILHTIIVSNGTWEHKLPLNGTQAQWVELPFNELFGDVANMKHVEEIMMRVRNERGGASEGTIWLDEIQAIRSDKYPMTLKPLPPPPRFSGGNPIRIDSGAATDRVDTQGRPWLADQGFIWGNQTGDVVCGYEFSYADTQDPLLYCTERVGFPGYRFAVENGNYLVRLHFVENWAPITTPGQRVFGLTINDTVYPDVDPFAQGGGLHKTSVREVPVTVSNGELHIGFATKRTQPRIAGLEILPVAAEAPKPSAKARSARSRQTKPNP
ncbi:MAG: malectin domain-containing carbohydrate-binding protein [Deltaproteobacteria bacterium]|nr:malectin domain-containing carbohydrate-binding protein [Deltaproteobacteria bacterium]